MDKDLKIIKNNYGEKMAHLCRELFSSLLDQEGLLPEILLSKFSPSHSLYEDIIKNEYEEDFKNFIFNFVDVEKERIVTKKSVRELLAEKGYDFFECNTEEDIQSFKKYYEPGEYLCTFNGDRLNRCHVFWAVKKDVDNIQRKDFKEPRRQDKYGTSVISIQFSRGNINTLSIKNRYNHKVNNPDATYSNNLENINSGLTEAFEREYGLTINQVEYQGFELPNYVVGNDKKLYRYNYEINNIYYCENNIIIADGEVIKLDKSRFLLTDYFIIDLKEKKVNVFDYFLNDSFTNLFNDNEYSKESSISKIEINKDKDNSKTIRMLHKNNQETIIKIDKYGKIIELKDEKATIIGNNFLRYNKSLGKIELPNVRLIENNFLYSNNKIEELDFPSLEEVKEEFMRSNRVINKINMPNIRKIGFGFLNRNRVLKEIDFPNAEEIGNCFIHNNETIKRISLPKVKFIGNYFLKYNKELEELELPNVEQIDEEFLYHNKKLTKLLLPKIKRIGYMFLNENDSLLEIDFPNLEVINFNFLANNTILKKANLPNLKRIGTSFLRYNIGLRELSLPSLEEKEEELLEYNRKVKIYLPNLKEKENKKGKSR